MLKILKSHHLEVVPLRFEAACQSKHNWGYINFLQLKDLLLVPAFGIDEDQQALLQINQTFPEYAAKEQIETIDASVITKFSGALNCVSWNILK